MIEKGENSEYQIDFIVKKNKKNTNALTNEKKCIKAICCEDKSAVGTSPVKVQYFEYV